MFKFTFFDKIGMVLLAAAVIGGTVVIFGGKPTAQIATERKLYIETQTAICVAHSIEQGGMTTVAQPYCTCMVTTLVNELGELEAHPPTNADIHDAEQACLGRLVR